jgi:DNA-binding NarL/FixJ family response regulator/HPt (histidine-containing phosphotransfer) domain-containing protein
MTKTAHWLPVETVILNGASIGMIEQVLDKARRSTAGRRPIVVLLVDDQQFVGVVVRQLLATESDIELHCCLEAVDAVAMANQVGPAIILQDLVMPEIDGLKLVGLFRANAMTAGTPIVVLSGNDDAETRGRALAAGATAYLVKLPPKADFVACIRLHASGEGTSSGPMPEAETPPPDVEETLDGSVLARFRDIDQAFTRRLIDQFLKEAESCVATLRGAAERHDPSALSMAAHALKGSAMTMGVRRLAALCVQVEERVAASPSVVMTPALMTAIDQELVRVRHALAADRPGDEPR